MLQSENFISLWVSTFYLQALLLSSESLEETKIVNASLKREEILRKFAAEEKTKYLKVMKELEEAKNKLSKESYERQMAVALKKLNFE